MDICNQEVRRLIPFLKWRTYRFSDDLRAHTAVEILEDAVRKKIVFPPDAYHLIREAIHSTSEPGSIQFAPQALISFLGKDLSKHLEKRLATVRRYDRLPLRRPRRIVSIIGAPRSGTSYLYNMLAFYTDWAVFTDSSHHLWAPYSLANVVKWFIRNKDEKFLLLDSKPIKLDPSFSLPGEGENILHRTIQVYQHLGAHSYEIINPPVLCNQGILERSISDHLYFFNSDTLLLKSPFNVFRIEFLQKIFPDVNWLFIHIFRDGRVTGTSIEENMFHYKKNGINLDGVNAWRMFTKLCLRICSEDIIHLPYDAVRLNPTSFVKYYLFLLNVIPRVDTQLKGKPFLAKDRVVKTGGYVEDVEAYLNRIAVEFV